MQSEQSQQQPSLVERLLKLNLEGVPDGATVYFCVVSGCEWQGLTDENGCEECGKVLPGAPTPRCVVNDHRLRDLLARARRQITPQKWEANYAALMVAMSQRRDALPPEVREIIKQSLGAAGPKIKALARGQDFQDDEWSRRLRELYLHTLGGLLDVAEAMQGSEKPRILLSH